MNRIILEVGENDRKTPNGSSDNLPDNAYTEGSILEFQEETKVEDVQFTRMATKK